MSDHIGNAHFDPAAAAVVVEALTITDEVVVREARHWTTGRRGPAVEDRTALVGADLATFVEEAVVLGARALTAMAQSTEARAVEQMLRDVGDRTADATRQAAELTGRAVRDASEAVVKVAADARKAITEADQQSRRELTAAVGSAKQELTAEMRRLFGGDSPELLDRLDPLLERFGATVDTTMRAGARELVDRAARQFDPSDPTSPLARHAAALAARQESLVQKIEKNHVELASKVDDLTTTLKVQEARATLAKVTPIKGGSFEEQIHDLMREIALGLGDEYVDTTRTVGLVPRSRKGDGLLRVDGGATNVVVEMTDSPRTGWGDYFDEAERNRGAVAALGIVRTLEQNAGHTIRVLGTRRLVVAFDPGENDPDLLRTILLLLRTAAVAAVTRTGGAEVATAEEKIGEAIEQLDKLNAVKTLATGIQKSASKIETECTGITTAVHRLLDQALHALTGAAGPRVVEVEPGVA